MRIALPALRADTRLYRRYVYQPEAPLNIPVYVYAGRGDANIGPQHVDAWWEQTTGVFAVRWFDGGHFYLQADPEPFLLALRQDLSA
jgi:surfactin synthase thioesterase subunit